MPPGVWYADEIYDTNYLERNIAGTTYVQAIPTPATPSIVQVPTQTLSLNSNVFNIPVYLRPAIVDGNFQVYNQYIPGTGSVYTPTTTSWTWNAAAGTSIVAIRAYNATWGGRNAPAASSVYFGIQQQGSMSQAITGLIPGARYSVSFYMTGRAVSLDGNNLNVRIGGNPAATGGTIDGGTTIYMNASVGSTTNWQYITTSTWTATATSMTITFASTNPLGGDRTVLLGNIQLNVIENLATVTWGISESDRVVASGGNTTTDLNGYRIHTFTSGTGSFVVTQGGLVEVLVIGGGGGGGSRFGGGGGGGGFVQRIVSLTPQTVTVTVGNGGAGGAAGAQQGGATGVT
jgi:hypothetical protein